jgi:hypothetical protein
MKKWLIVTTAWLLGGASSVEAQFVIFHGTEQCTHDCGKRDLCFWVDSSDGWSHHDLSALEVSRDSSSAFVKSWRNRIRSVYVSHDFTEVMLYDDPNFGGKHVRLRGAGCHNLSHWSFWDRAESVEVE